MSSARDLLSSTGNSTSSGPLHTLLRGSVEGNRKKKVAPDSTNTTRSYLVIPDSDAVSAHLEHLQKEVEKAVTRLNLPDGPAGLYDPVRYVLGMGGKRLRPIMVLLAAEGVSDSPDQAREAALSPAMGVEVFHNFSLLHDDIMDHAPIRRGQPTVHIKWSPSTAILSGDLMLVEAFRLASQGPAAVSADIMATFSQTAREVCEGQQLDMDFETRSDVTVSEYMSMIERKTAVLLAASLSIGARCGGADSQVADLLYRYGIAVGLAFQLRDDYLDAWGDPERFGKTVGGDIIQNKKTFLLIRALEKASGDDLSELQDWLSRESFDAEEKVTAVLGIFDRLGIQEEARAEESRYADEASALMSELESLGVRTQMLRGFVRALMARQH